MTPNSSQALLGNASQFSRAAVLTAAGAALGLLCLRIAHASAPSLAAELAANGGVYLYVFVATAVVFLSLGFTLRRQVDELQRLSSTDALTGLQNRHALQARLGTEWTSALRTAEPLALLLIDLDGLKRINDELGHAAGDRALRQVAAAIKVTLRATDLGVRWGGDEFAIVAPRTASTAAFGLAERLVGHLTRHARSADVPMTVSIGVAVLDPSRQPRDRVEDMMRAADRALYDAKTNGRNQVRIAPIPDATAPVWPDALNRVIV